MLETVRNGAGQKTVASRSKASLDPIERIEADHVLQLKLCEALEFIADGLPDRIDRRLVREVTGVLTRGIAKHFRFEEQVLFPLLQKRAASDPALMPALDQLKKEHARDEDISQELADELRLLDERGSARNPEMLGYMLRGFFEGQRRHIEWENALVLPLARKVLLPEDLQQLAKQLPSGD